MTHWARPRGLTADQRTLTADRLEAIAAQLRADHAAAVMANLRAAADPTPWPATTGGAGSSSDPSSPVEMAILAPQPGNGIGPRAARLLAAIHQLATLAATVDPGLAEWSPVRVIARCPACGDPLRPDRRCSACGTRERSVGTCGDCGHPEDRHGLRPWPPKSWTGYTDGTTRTLCVTDWMWRHRHEGRARNGIERLALSDGLITDDLAGAAG